MANPFIIEDSLSIHLFSADGVSQNGSMLSDLTFQTQGVYQDDENILYTECALIQAQIPNSWFLVNSNNDTLNYFFGEDDWTIQLTHGNYTGTSLITELVAKFLSAHGHEFTITLSSCTGKLIFENPTPSLGNFTFYGTSSFKEIIGFETTITSSGYILAMPFLADLLGTLSIKICSNKLNTQNTDTVLTSILQTIPITGSSYDLTSWTNNNNSKSLLANRVLDFIDIKLYNDKNQLVDMNGVNWNMTVKLTL